MKKIFLYCIIIIGVVFSLIKTFFSDTKEVTSYTITYSGTVSDNNVFLYNSFTGDQINDKYNLNHILSFQENNEKLIDIKIYHILQGEKQSFTIQNYSISNKKGNYRLDVFAKNLLKTNKNKEIFITDTGLQYTTKNIPGLLSNITVIEGSYNNQLQEKNKFQINIQSYCGLGQYFKKSYICDIEGIIIATLPINESQKKRTIQGTLTKKKI